MILTYDLVAKRIDHSLLNPTMDDAELEAGCRLAADYAVASVCIKPYAVADASRILKGSGVAVGTTIGFPHGGHNKAVKVFEAERALEEGATELDMVVNVGKVLSGDWEPVRLEIEAITRIAHAGKALVKVIFENCYLKDEHKARLCRICGEVGADYVKTSTGYGTGGATRDDLILMRREAPPQVKLKAAGGVRTLDGCLEVIALGCDRIGASRTAEILDELKGRISKGNASIPTGGAVDSSLGGSY